jgi:hypothetical protein
VTVIGVRRYKAVTRVYNLTVGDLHTYFVGAGLTSVLVHNCGPFSDEVEQGLDHMEARIDEGADNHRIAGCSSRCETGEYLSGFESRAADHVDTKSGAEIIVDRSTRDGRDRPVVIIRKSWSIHGYHMSDSSIAGKLASGDWG